MDPLSQQASPPLDSALSSRDSVRRLGVVYFGPYMPEEMGGFASNLDKIPARMLDRLPLCAARGIVTESVPVSFSAPVSCFEQGSCVCNYLGRVRELQIPFARVWRQQEPGMWFEVSLEARPVIGKSNTAASHPLTLRKGVLGKLFRFKLYQISQR
ncbi:hypothetical protein DFH09DRAFT_1197807 [Mycena vulgaris]|nr:hypothetical protein DFH09DRAFT_1197807 [Mycena vulgaris]